MTHGGGAGAGAGGFGSGSLRASFSQVLNHGDWVQSGSGGFSPGRGSGPACVGVCSFISICVPFLSLSKASAEWEVYLMRAN